MPRTIVYKAGGFTNCGIGYTKFSQEELAEMKDRVMTENEAIKILRKDSCYECAQGTDSPVNCEYRECRVAEATRAAIKALEECRAAVEKQTAKRPRIIGNAMICPSCPRCFKSASPTYCPSCGQMIDWGNEE